MTLILTIEIHVLRKAGVSNILSNKGSLHCLYTLNLWMTRFGAILLTLPIFCCLCSGTFFYTFKSLIHAIIFRPLIYQIL